MNGSSFDVVIPTIGRDSLATLLRSLESSQGPRPSRILLVDDRRPTGEPLLRNEPSGWLAGRVSVVRGASRGPAAARNLGWRAGSGEWVAFLDDDVAVTRTWLEDLDRDLKSAGERVAAVQGRVSVPRPQGRRLTDWERNVAALETAKWITADMAVRRSALASVNGFDERFPRAYREDADLALRLLARGDEILWGARRIEHPVREAPWWVSVRLQAGNRDDALMRRLYGRRWRRLGGWATKRPRYFATTGAALLALVAGIARRRSLASLAFSAWFASTAEMSWRRISPGPREPREVMAMVATSVLIPPVATFWWLNGAAWALRNISRANPHRLCARR
ncbi:MAG TPA: glycosyltransferase [Candidatus Sulfotelmatobacter sp.]|nr:glycosyltransferase [Candidatus Sulfotelmatobacter sp.]